MFRNILILLRASKPFSLAAPCVLVLALASGAAAESTLKVWTGAAGGTLWHNPGNWDPSGAPTADDDVVIDVPEAFTVNISSSNATARSITLANTLAITNRTLTVTNGITLEGGTVNLTSTNTFHAVLELTGDSASIDGWGEIRLNPGGGSTTFRPGPESALTIGQDVTVYTVDGSGGTVVIGSDSVAAETINRGLISSEAAGRTVELRGVFTNEGLLQAINNGILILGGYWTTESLGTFASASGGTVRLAGTLDNAGWNLHLDDDTGSLTLVGGTIVGGVITAAGGAQLLFTFAGGTLDGVTLASPFEFTNATITVKNGLVLDNATITLTQTAPIGSVLQFNGGTQFLGGTGEILLNNTGGGWIAVRPDVETTLVIGPDITIRRTGTGGGISFVGSLTDNGITINQGLITSETPARTLRIVGDFTNEGLMQAVNKGVLELAGNYWTTSRLGSFASSSNGEVRLTGVLDNTSSTLHLNENTGPLTLGSATIIGGVIANNGMPLIVASTSTLDGLTLSGEFSLIGSAGYFRIRNGLTLNNAVIELAHGLGFDGATQTLGGSGEILSNGASIVPEANTTLIIGPGIVIRSSASTMYIGHSTSTPMVINHGVISAEAPNAEIILRGHFVNQGLVQAINGGILSFTSHHWTTERLGAFASSDGGTLRMWGATLDNTNSVLHLNDDTGSLTITTVTIVGGVINTEGAAQLVMSGSSGVLDGVTLAGNLTTFGHVLTITIRNGLTLDGGTIILVPPNHPNANCRLRFDGGDQTLGGKGEVLLHAFHDVGSLLQVFPENNTTLTIGPDVTIRRPSEATGSIFAIVGSTVASASTINLGTISAETRTIQLRRVTNDGHLQVSNGATMIHFWQGGLEFVNTGTILLLEATLSLQGAWHNGGTITTIDSTINLGNTFTIANIGTIERIGGTVNIVGTLSLTGDTLHLDDETGSWTLAGGTIIGGLVSSEGKARLLASGPSPSTLNGVTLSSDFECTNTTVRVNNNLTLAGSTVTITQTGTTQCHLRFVGGTQTLGGFGEVLLNNMGTVWTVLEPASNTTLLIGPDITIRRPAWSAPTGLSFVGSMTTSTTTINEGTISSETADAVMLLKRMTSTGLVRAINGSTVEGGGVLNYSAGTLSGGTWEVRQDATLTFPWGAAIHTLADGAAVTLIGENSNFPAINTLTTIADGASFELAGGRGFIADAPDGVFAVNGSLNIGPGSDFDVNGWISFGPDSQTAITLQSVDDTPIECTGGAWLDGTLKVVLTDEFSMDDDDDVALISVTEGEIIGAFDAVKFPPSQECLLDLTYHEQAVTLVPGPGIPGDLNADCAVDVNDMLLLLEAWGACTNCSECPADLNGDCAVDVLDLLILLDKWG